jgi:hypothetical protein
VGRLKPDGIEDRTAIGMRVRGLSPTSRRELFAVVGRDAAA